MTEYQLQILRTETILPSKEAALSLLNAYVHHRIGQPVAVLYKDSNGDTKVLYAIGKKDPDTVPEGQAKCGPDFYDIIGSDGGGTTTEAVLAEDVVSNYPTSVGYVKTGDKLEKGTNMTDVIKKILTGEIYPDDMNTFVPLYISASVTASTKASISIKITNSAGATINSGNTIEAGTPLTLKAMTISTSGTKTLDNAGTITVKNSGSDNLIYGYKVYSSEIVKNTEYTAALIAIQKTSAYVKTNTKSGGFSGITIGEQTTSQQDFKVTSGSNSLVLQTVSAGGNAILQNDEKLHYISNTGNTSDEHVFKIDASTQSYNYGNSTATYSWSCTGDYPVFTYVGTSDPVSLTRSGWTNAGWLPSGGVLFSGGVTVPQGSYFAIAIPSGWKLNDLDSGFAGVSVISHVSNATSAVSALDGTSYTVHYIQATATGNTVYLNAKISK